MSLKSAKLPSLLDKHEAQAAAAKDAELQVEVVGARVVETPLEKVKKVFRKKKV